MAIPPEMCVSTQRQRTNFILLIITNHIGKRNFFEKKSAYFGKVCYVVIDKYTYLWTMFQAMHLNDDNRGRRYIMKLTLEERFRKKFIKFGKKNKICRMIAIPVMAVGMFFFHGVSYLSGNVKRLAMLPMTFLFFAVYSSFSFPIFISNDETDNGLNPISEEAKDIVLAEQVEIDLDDIRLLDEEEMLLEEGSMLPEGGEYLETHGDFYELYSAAEILEAAQGREPQTSRSEVQEDVEFSRDDWKLILVNKQHSIPDDYVVKLGKIKTMKGTQYCDERIIDDLLAMLQAAEDDHVSLQVCSPYRTTAYQEMLFDNHIKKYMKKGLSYMEAFQLSSVAVTVPGASEHQIGLALDIVTPTHQNLTESFADTDAGKWLAENGYKYG